MRLRRLKEVRVMIDGYCIEVSQYHKHLYFDVHVKGCDEQNHPSIGVSASKKFSRRELRGIAYKFYRERKAFIDLAFER